MTLSLTPAEIRGSNWASWRIAAAAGIVLLSACATPDPVATVPPASPPVTESPVPTSVPAVTASETATPASTTGESTPPPSSPVSWAEVAVFGGEGESFANDVVSSSFGFVAVGSEYQQRLPNLGPPPAHEGRVWTSADGSTWTDATPADTFADVSLDYVFTTSAGSLRTFGTVSEVNEFGQLSTAGTGMWESADGATWTPVALPFPSSSFVNDFGHGGRGNVALVTPGTGGEADLWFSADGQTWQRVQAVNGARDMDAGDEGFVLTGDAGTFDAPSPYVIASGDGLSWVTATAPPSPSGHVAPLLGDWIVIGEPPIAEGDHPVATVWGSANGLEWSGAGTMPRATVEVSGGTTCREFVGGAIGVGAWVVVNTTLSGPCSEGGFVTHGTQRVSSDSGAWVDLPFASSLPETGGGSAVFAGAPGDGLTVLVGQSNLKAAFWLGPGNPTGS